MEISLSYILNTFLPGAGSNVYILLLLKTNEKVFYFNFLDQKSLI